MEQSEGGRGGGCKPSCDLLAHYKAKQHSRVCTAGLNAHELARTCTCSVPPPVLDGAIWFSFFSLHIMTVLFFIGVR